MFDNLIERMKNSEGVTEKLKEENQIEWVRRTQNIEVRVCEIISENLIYR